MKITPRIAVWSWLLLALAFFSMPLLLLAQTNTNTVPTPPPAAQPGDSPLTSGGDLDLFSAMWKQVAGNPASLMLIIFLSIIAWLIDASFMTSKIIPWVCVVVGGFGYWLLSSPGSVPPGFPRPWAVLIVNGVVCGFISYTIGFVSLKKFVLSRFKSSGETKPATN